LGNVNFIGELLLEKVISKRVIEICNSSMMSSFITEYQMWHVDSDKESKRFEDHLEGIITLNQKVGKCMDEPDKKK
jgi:regulatory protein YycI of two-component signal transduction system YycFG